MSQSFCRENAESVLNHGPRDTDRPTAIARVSHDCHCRCIQLAICTSVIPTRLRPPPFRRPLVPTIAVVRVRQTALNVPQNRDAMNPPARTTRKVLGSPPA
jgi:hypothetical protein